MVTTPLHVYFTNISSYTFHGIINLQSDLLLLMMVVTQKFVSHNIQNISTIIFMTCNVFKPLLHHCHLPKVLKLLFSVSLEAIDLKWLIAFLISVLT